MNTDALTDVAHVVQTAITPVFLLSGVGTLLNVFSSRLGRVVDHYNNLTELLGTMSEGPEATRLVRHLRRLRTRRSALDTAVILGGMGGALTCCAAFALFLVGLHNEAGSRVLLWLFGGALSCTILALIAFLVDTVLAWHGLRQDGAMPHATRAP